MSVMAKRNKKLANELEARDTSIVRLNDKLVKLDKLKYKLEHDLERYKKLLTLPQQYSTVTYGGRHRFILEKLNQLLVDGSESKILSFGCSEGYECKDLRSLFPLSKVYGCDVSNTAIAKAKELVRDDDIDIFYSSDLELNKRAPFDLVTVFNVLCSYPTSKGKNDISNIYPFHSYDELLTIVDRYVKIGGFIIIYNSNYFFEQSSIYKKYKPVDVGFKTNGWMNKYYKDGKLATSVKYIYDGVDYESDDENLRNSVKQNGELFENAVEVFIEHINCNAEMKTKHSLKTVVWQKIY